MSDREKIRAFVLGAQEAAGADLADSPSQSPEFGYASGQDDLCDNILAHIDSLPPPAADAKLAELARDVKDMWARAHDAAQRLAQVPLDDMFAHTECRKHGTRANLCAYFLHRICELNERGETDAESADSGV